MRGTNCTKPSSPLHHASMHSTVCQSLVNIMSGLSEHGASPGEEGIMTELGALPHCGSFALSGWDRSNAGEPSPNEQLAVDASDCVFWCAVAIGGLVQGRPTASVSRSYIRRNIKALHPILW